MMQALELLDSTSDRAVLNNGLTIATDRDVT